MQRLKGNATPLGCMPRKLHALQTADVELGKPQTSLELGVQGGSARPASSTHWGAPGLQSLDSEASEACGLRSPANFYAFEGKMLRCCSVCHEAGQGRFTKHLGSVSDLLVSQAPAAFLPWRTKLSWQRSCGRAVLHLGPVS